jgi:uncharacterized membrane protein
MDSLRAPLATLAALGVVRWLHMRHYVGRLPDRVATHFNASGAPDGWMTPSGLQSFDLVLTAFVLAVVVGSALLIRVLPAWMINVPNRDHWFAPERRRQSHHRLLVHMLWLACAVVGLLIGVHHLVVLANLQAGPPRLSGIGLISLVAGFLAVLVLWTVRLYRLFPRPHPQPG